MLSLHGMLLGLKPDNVVDNHKLQQLLALSEQMLVLALEGDWDGLSHLEIEQGILAREIFVAVQACSTDEQILITRVNALIIQVIELAEQNRAALAEEMKQLKKGNEVQHAYLQNYD